MTEIPMLLWQPTEKQITETNLTQYMLWLASHRGVSFQNYTELWAWSVEQPADFWESLWVYFQIIHAVSFTKVMSDHPMPNTKWFEGSHLNYAENVFKNETTLYPAIIFNAENQLVTEISWVELKSQVASLAHFLKENGVTKGDRVVGFLPNIPQATVALLACMCVGAVWSSCSPDFGLESVTDRFAQIEPKVFIAADGYQYGGKAFDKIKIVEKIILSLPTLKTTILVPYLNPDSAISYSSYVTWKNVVSTPHLPLFFEQLPFDFPIWILYSSGTTGIPKAITHSHGGVLLEHLKYLTFHNDVRRGERFFWFTTTGWMMWNFVNASLLVGATMVLYDGSPGFPDLNCLWKLSQDVKINHFGTSAPFLIACQKAGLQPKNNFDLSALRSVSSTGSPLPPESYQFVYQLVRSDIWLCSMSGGTDVCTAFVGGCPLLPVFQGEIQCRALGCAMESWDENGVAQTENVGEMVVTKPMPSMPVFFWGDDEKQSKYLSSYFDMYPNVWRHGDWLKITTRGSLIIYGRSDATLNRQGVRIGTSEIYRALDKMMELKDALIINIERPDGTDTMPLFVTLHSGFLLDEILISKIKNNLKTEYSPRHVPDEIIEILDIPYTISGKKMETPVKKILMRQPLEKAVNFGAMKNPEAMAFFINLAKERNFILSTHI